MSIHVMRRPSVRRFWLAAVVAALSVFAAGLAFPQTADAASTKYMLQSRFTKDGKYWCLDAAGPGALMYVAHCNSARASQKFYYGTAPTGYAVLTSVGYPGTAITASAVASNVSLKLLPITGKANQGFIWDSLGNQGFNIYAQANRRYAFTVYNRKLGSDVRLYTTENCVCDGWQSWAMAVTR